MTLSPLMIKIVLHYFTLPTDFQNGDFSPCGVAEAITCLIDAYGLIELNPVAAPITQGRLQYRISERGRVYAEALTKVPLPVKRWVTP